MYKFCIFLGPSLDTNQAQSILPEALFLGPVQCGDILKVLRLQPETIVIIDGYFDNVPSVWHKEILFAIECGVEIFGTSSMGALRASELYQFGVKPFGKVCKKFQSGEIVSDDEVAVLHTSEKNGYQTITQSLVDIREILNNAKRDQVITSELYEYLLKVAKKTHYKQRILTKLIRDAAISKDIKSSLLDWLSFNKFSQKQSDAINLLTFLANRKDLDNKKSLGCKIQKSINFRKLHKKMYCEPFTKNFYATLPLAEQIAIKASKDKFLYKQLYHLAHLIATLYTYGINKYNIVRQAKYSNIKNTDYFLSILAITNNDSKCNYKTTKTLRRLKVINELYNEFLPNSKCSVKDHFNYIKYYQFIVNRKEACYTKDTLALSSAKTPVNIKNNLAIINGILLHLFDSLLTKHSNLQINDENIKHFSLLFRKNNNLLKASELKKWLEMHDLSSEDYFDFIKNTANFEALVLNNNLDILNIHYPCEQVFWLEDALHLSGSWSFFTE